MCSSGLTGFIIGTGRLANKVIIGQVNGVCSCVFISRVRSVTKCSLRVVGYLFSLGSSILLIKSPERIACRARSRTGCGGCASNGVGRFVRRRYSRLSISVSRAALGGACQGGGPVYGFTGSVCDGFGPYRCIRRGPAKRSKIFFMSPSSMSTCLSACRPVRLESAEEASMGSACPMVGLKRSGKLAFREMLVCPASGVLS